MKAAPYLLVPAVAVVGVAGPWAGPDRGPPAAPVEAEGPAGLRPPSAFEAIADDRARAEALFDEMGRVLQHPRCVNCHPAGDRPLQGDDGRLHEPAVERGGAGFGRPGMRCSTCHATENVRVSGDFSVPGNPAWHLAPAETAWEGRSLGEICRQVRDPERNGGMDLEELVHHLAEDDLVGWGWEPGVGREPAPGTQARLGALARAWVDAGAACPGEAGG